MSVDGMFTVVAVPWIYAEWHGGALYVYYETALEAAPDGIGVRVEETRSAVTLFMRLPVEEDGTPATLAAAAVQGAAVVRPAVVRAVLPLWDPERRQFADAAYASDALFVDHLDTLLGDLRHSAVAVPAILSPE